TRPEGLGGSRNAGSATADPRPPYVTEAEQHNNVGGGYGYGTATPYSGYGRTGRTGRTKEGTTGQARRAFFSNTISLRVLTEDLPWPAAKTALLRYYGAFNQIRTVGFYEKLRRHEARRPKTKDTIDWLEKHAFFCRKVGPGPDESTEHSYGLFQALPKEIQFGGSARHSYTHTQGTRPEGLGGSRNAGSATADPRPPYVTEAVRGGYGYGTATPYSGYGRTGRTGQQVKQGVPSSAIQSASV
ncbi:hypothetical protein L249_2577, partial [Ophiocordyceps polyrhachis-furcata BCC 54312]